MVRWVARCLQATCGTGVLNMGFFASVAERAAQGFNWGKSAAEKGWSVSKDLAQNAVDKAESMASSAWDATKEAAGAVRQGARNTVASGTAAGAEKATAWAVADKTRFDSLRDKLDKRDRFASTVTQPCGNPDTKHPDKRDGQFMGKDCPVTHATKPTEGTKPGGCDCGKGGKPLPKVTFTNGINNIPQQVCATMHALANSRCVEVIGIFNATYQDPSIKAPDRQLADYKHAAAQGGLSALKGAGTGLLTGGLVGAASGAGTGLVKGAAPDVALQEASRLGLVQDIVDCIDTINKGGAEAAAHTLSKEIVAALNAEPPEMTIYAHSQGGLNTGAAIAQARKELVAAEKDRLMNSGVSKTAAAAQAAQLAEGKLAGLEVNTFGTLERGLPDGPKYNRFTNDYDPVPKVIRAAQQGLTPDLVGRDPKGAPPVQRFKAAPSMDPMSAHGMNESYLPYLNKARPMGPCC